MTCQKCFLDQGQVNKSLLSKVLTKYAANTTHSITIIDYYEYYTGAVNKTLIGGKRNGYILETR